MAIGHASNRPQKGSEMPRKASIGAQKGSFWPRIGVRRLTDIGDEAMSWTLSDPKKSTKEPIDLSLLENSGRFTNHELIADLVLAMTGASGSVYGVRLMEVLLRAGRRVH